MPDENSYGWDTRPQAPTPDHSTAPEQGPAPEHRPTHAADGTAAQGTAFTPAFTPAPAPVRTRRGPSWAGVIGLVAAGGILSSGLTLGGVLGYDALTDTGGPVASASAPATAGGTAARTAAATGSIDWETVASAVSPSTVAITVATTQGQAEGTGVIHDAQGDIVTNNHVVAGAQKISVRLADGRAFSASVVGTDPSTDLAVIRLENPPADLKPATFGDSSQVTVGQPVMAVGTPLGLDNTVTTGIISAIHRPVSTQGETGATGAEGSGDAAYTSALQTDAAINPGNSGGPLVDGSGTVIGINSSIAGLASTEATQETQSGSIGLGFAIPSSTVTLITDQLIEHGTAQHALLGVTASDGDQDSQGASYSGALVRSVVDGGPAQQAGLRQGDLVLSVDDVPIGDATGLTAYVRSLAVGSTHEVKYLRDGTEATASVTLSQAS